MTAIMFVKVCVLVLQIRGSLPFVPPIGEIGKNGLQPDAINLRPLLPKADAKGADYTYDATFTGTEIEQLQNKWSDLDVTFPKLKKDSTYLEMERLLPEQRGKERLLGLPLSQEHNILEKDSNSEVSDEEEIFHLKDSDMKADDSMAVILGQEYSDEPEMMSHDQLGNSDVCPIVEPSLLQSNPFDQLKRFTEWCNKTTTKGKPDQKNQKTKLNETEPKVPLNYTSFSMNLVRENFISFEREMNEELALVNKTFEGPNWELDAYKIFVALSFCPLADFYEVTTDENTPNGKICHLMVPTDDNFVNKTAFILNYGLSQSEQSMREMAKKELAKMVAGNLGADLREFVPAARRLYRIFIAFHGPEGAVEHEGPTQLRPPGHNSTTETIPVETKLH